MGNGGDPRRNVGVAVGQALTEHPHHGQVPARQRLPAAISQLLRDGGLGHMSVNSTTARIRRMTTRTRSSVTGCRANAKVRRSGEVKRGGDAQGVGPEELGCLHCTLFRGRGWPREPMPRLVSVDQGLTTPLGRSQTCAHAPSCSWGRNSQRRDNSQTASPPRGNNTSAEAPVSEPLLEPKVFLADAPWRLFVVSPRVNWCPAGSLRAYHAPTELDTQS